MGPAPASQYSGLAEAGDWGLTRALNLNSWTWSRAPNVAPHLPWDRPARASSPQPRAVAPSPQPPSPPPPAPSIPLDASVRSSYYHARSLPPSTPPEVRSMVVIRAVTEDLAFPEGPFELPDGDLAVVEIRTG